VGTDTVKKIGDTDTFVKGIHSAGELDPARRFIMHFPQDSLVMSYGSGYGGNALLGKKCIALRIASALGRKEGWLAEHMIIIGVTDPKGTTTYFLGAFPSACGKTNLAMIEPCFPGYKVETLGDDIAWINIGPDGRMYAINPEAGFFGVLPGTSQKTNPKFVETITSDKFFPTLYTNAALNTDDNTPWWEGFTPDTPKHMLDWKGNAYDPAKGEAAAHANARVTASIYNCPTLSKEVDNPKGVPISGIIFGGRRRDTIPLVMETKTWKDGVFAASILGSETTAAAAGQTGTVRRDPMAMLPFCGYNMADYFAHWLSFAKRSNKLPKIFIVNWFKKDANGKFIWPGFGDNFRILKWMIDRVQGTTDAVETPLGLMPKKGAIDMSGLAISDEQHATLFEVRQEQWRTELDDAEKFYAQFGDKIPAVLTEQLNELKAKIG